MIALLRSEVRTEPDLVHARQRARDLAELLGFDGQNQSRIATALSEIARNALVYGGGGSVDYGLTAKPMALEVVVRDAGPGIRDLEQVLAGRYTSTTGMGLGILGARRLMDEVEIESTPGGTTVTLRKLLPRGKLMPGPQEIDRILRELTARRPPTPFELLQQHNHELAEALLNVRQRELELVELNRELEETNRGVVALYAELEERADQLRRASDLKSRFLSNMSHEFRTPLGSIISIAELLLARVDGELSSEQDKQVRLIHGSARELAQLVNDLLDLAKVEAGKVDVRIEPFTVSELFSGLRAVMRPLAVNPRVELVFEDVEAVGQMQSDDTKIGQVLRNFISNALKFTEEGRVTVSARRGPADTIIFAVADTGIGIAKDDRRRIFEEFTQVENPLQRKVKGTGLGLPLTQRLAELLGGRVIVESEPGKGSTFSVVLPRICPPPAPPREVGAALRIERRQLSGTVLVVDDEEAPRYVLSQQLGDGYRVIEADGGRDGLHRAREAPLDAIFLDLSMPDLSGEQVLRELRAAPATAHVPVILYTSRELPDDQRFELSEQGVVAVIDKLQPSREQFRASLNRALQAAGLPGLDGEGGEGRTRG